MKIPSFALLLPISLLLRGLGAGVIPLVAAPDLDLSRAPAPDPIAQEAQPNLAELGPGPRHKLLFNQSRRAELIALQAAGGVLSIEDYGSFAVAVVEESFFGGREALAASGLPIRDELDRLSLGGLSFYSSQMRDVVETQSQALLIGDGDELDPEAGLYVVQFRGPVRDEWIAMLDEMGVRFRQYTPMNAYVVALQPDRVHLLQGEAQTGSAIQLVEEYHPAFRMRADLREAALGAGGETLPLTIQLIDGGGIRDLVREIEALSARSLGVVRIGPYVNLKVDIDSRYLLNLARRPQVFAIEARGMRARMDERQGQTIAGNVTGANPDGPGYLAWLASVGFNASQFGDFSINVVDDATFLTGHPDIASGRVDFAQNPTSQTGLEAGHGFINAQIAAGLNNSSGSAFEDGLGYQYGLGIAPWAHVGSTAIFGPGGLNPSAYESSAYASGARISTNSWSFIDGNQNPIPVYDSSAQLYDFLVRDVNNVSSGNQEYMVLFSAGNDGPTSNTVSTPSTAKNILTVGASENDRPTGTDGCAVTNSGADDIRDVIDFSSRGPVDLSGGDGRWKPEISAPGTHIQGGVPQSSFGGGGVCNDYFPSGQTLYGWSSGTSHSTPAVAGGAALVYQWFLNQGSSAPSPAMTKAVIANSAEYMTGVGAGDTLPSNSQGMGLANFGRSFDTLGKLISDQDQVLGSTGASFNLVGDVDEPSSPFRVTLVWTDAPGSTTGAAWVNDLDLTVNLGGQTYRGNVFSGANSITGGSADFRNNTESVFLPAGVSGAFTVTVTAANIAGDGIPGFGDSTDQDFALFVYNAVDPSSGTTAQFVGNPVSGEVPLLVNFSDLSSADVTNWSWDFGDGGNSNLENPSHTYTTAGTYDVALTVTGDDGMVTETKFNYIVASDPPPPGVSDASFELQSAGTSPSSPWSVSFGSGHLIRPSGVSSDSGMPSDGGQWCDIAADSTNGATPPSNPGGLTTPAIGGAGIQQSFNMPAGLSTLEFEASFLRNEAQNEPVYVDWMSVDISDGSSTFNLFFKDTFSTTSGTSAQHGFAITPIETVSADLLSLFPTATTSTVFTLTAQVGNGTDDFQPSRGYVDNFRLTGVPLIAEFSGTPTSGVAPLSVNFTDASSGGVTGWLWDFGDTGNSTLQNPSHNYTAPGTYTVTLTASGPSGSDAEVKSGYITVSDVPPVAEFSGTPTSGVAPFTVNFSDASTGNVTSWAWDFGDTGSSTAQNPSHEYTTPGTYTVTLTATGPGGADSEIKVGYITVADPPPVAEFSGAPVNGVAPYTVNFSDASTGNVTSWAWDFGDTGSSTAQNPSHEYTTPGTYTVSLTATGPGGADSEIKVGYITVADPPPVAEFNGAPVSGVAPYTVNFNDASTGNVTSWAWDFGDTGSSTAQNPSHEYTTPGTYTVTLTATGPGGADSEIKVGYITVADPPPVAEFNGAPVSGVAPFTVNFSDASTGNVTSWAWDFGDTGSSTAQNPSHEYTTPGTYTVTLTATGPGGADSEIKVGYITVADPPPVAEFSGAPTSGVAPYTVNFSDASTGNVTSWAWDFGDTGSSTAQNPSHEYTTPGTYTVTLTATGPGGADSEIKVGYITVADPPPVAEFNGAPVSGVAPFTVNFSDTSTGNVTSWAWDFGDTGSSTAQNPSHEYTTPGSYTVTLTATGPGGADSEIKVGYITVADPPPVAEFSGAPTNGVAPFTVNFSDASTGNVTSWAWDFGDTGSSTAQNPSHEYTAPGTYTVTLTATGPGGADSEIKVGYITVADPPPVAEFSGAPTSGVAPFTVNFSDASTGNVTSWAWDFGDTGSSMAQNPSHEYTTPGTYTVTLTVSGPGGADSEIKVGYITVADPPPVAEFSGAPTSGVAPYTVNFSDASTGNVTSWAWDFGDTGSSMAQNPSHEYTTPGTYTVTLTVFGPGGADSEIKVGYITVADPPPVAEFSGAPTSGVAPFTVNFSDASTGNVTNWAWDFGDTGSSTAQNPSHEYTTPGTYTVTLTATGPGGADSEIKVGYITVADPPPVAEFSGAPTNGVAPFTVNFSDASTGNVTNWAWDFGDTGSSTAQNPNHEYTTPGTYTVTLTATGPGGADSEIKIGYITVADPPPVAEFSGAPTNGVAPFTVNFSDASTGNVTSWAWDFGDTGSSTAQNPSHEYTTPGTYTVTLTATGPGGADSEIKVGYITVLDPPPVAEFNGVPTSGVAPFTVNFSDASTGNVTSWAWDFGDTGSSVAQNPSYEYTTPGTYTVALTATGPGGFDTETKVDLIVVHAPVTIGGITPATIEVLQVGSSETVSVLGTGFLPSTTVEVDGVQLSSGFTVVSDSEITIAWPLVSALGAVDVTVSNANGNASTSMTVVANSSPALQFNSGDNPVQASSASGLSWTVASEPLDLFILLVSFEDTPSFIPGLYDLQIGNNSSSLVQFKSYFIGAKGYVSKGVPSFSGIDPLLTLYWQGIVIDLAQTTPLPASNVQETFIVD